MNRTKQLIKNFLPYVVHEKLFPKTQVVLEDTQLGEPQIYNKCGQQMRVFYLQDRLGAHLPYSSITTLPQRILWDRYNYTLPIHFYGSQDVLEIKGNPRKRFAWLTEAESIDGQSYDRILSSSALSNSFDAIFTYSQRVLEKCSNAKFIPAMQTWYGSIKEGGVYDPLRYEKKTKNISMICSNKVFCEWHEKRNNIAGKYKDSQYVDVLGTFTGTYLNKKAEALDDYRYSIVIENAISPFYFTEKILDCFGAMTVPIYIGAPRIGEFFNIDGIIIVDPEEYNNIEEIIRSCSRADYESRKAAIIENFNKVQHFLNLEDYFLEHYSSLF